MGEWDPNPVLLNPDPLLCPGGPSSEPLGSEDRVTPWAGRPSKLPLHHTTTVRDPGHGFTHPKVASIGPLLLEGV